VEAVRAVEDMLNSLALSDDWQALKAIALVQPKQQLRGETK
jgi:muramoyltetrapeptide carboxypeptidase LdcA involved in peptidoglycan recycling